jgi:hypothetical protein
MPTVYALPNLTGEMRLQSLGSPVYRALSALNIKKWAKNGIF